MTSQAYKKTGQHLLPTFKTNEKLNDPELYRPSDDLVDAVNVALTLGQPLLLTGDPGTGKTELAWHIAYQFKLGGELDEETKTMVYKPLVFTAQTTSNATDLFYKYDAIGHFQYNHNQNNKDPLPVEEIEKLYIHYNALGEAIKRQERLVVLIDEIDKAPRDLPNDILFAIEKLSFKVPELKNKEHKTSKTLRPIIILTSNSEKNLPDAFLRRVVYYHIPPPTQAELLEILSLKTDGFTKIERELIIDHFNDILEMGFKKRPATAELIYWALLLKDLEFPINQLGKKLTGDNKQKLAMSYSVLAKNREDLELLKTKLGK